MDLKPLTFLFVVFSILLSCGNHPKSNPIYSQNQTPKLVPKTFEQFILELNTNCEQKRSSGGIRYEYCMVQKKSEPSQKIIYYFHGIFGDAKSSIPFIQSILHLWSKASNEPLPKVVAVSFGRTWFLTNKNRGFLNNDPDLNYYSVFKNEFIPQFENELGFDSKNIPERALWGTSMGGLSSLLFVLKNASEKDRALSFSKIILDCPALFTVTPYSDPKEQVQFLNQYKEVINQKKIIFQGYPFFLKEFPSYQIWKKEDPEELIQKVNLETFLNTKILMTASEYDEWGFYPGAIHLNQILNQKFSNVFFQTKPVKHCQFSMDDQIQFLLN